MITQTMASSTTPWVLQEACRSNGQSPRPASTRRCPGPRERAPSNEFTGCHSGSLDGREAVRQCKVRGEGRPSNMLCVYIHLVRAHFDLNTLVPIPLNCDSDFGHCLASSQSKAERIREVAE